MYLLLGYGISNKSIEKFLESKKEEFIIYDDNIYPSDKIDFDKIDLIIKSPGVDLDHWIIKIALNRGIKIVTDIEYMSYFKDCNNIIVVTGTLGKTTTTNLINEILSEEVSIDMMGNMGRPIFNYIYSKNDALIEASSFMLEFVNNFRSNINVILNLSIAHQDHHKSFTNYVKAKMKLIKNIRKEDIIIYNYDDILLRRLVEVKDCVKVPFSLRKKVDGAFLCDNFLYCFNEKIINIKDIQLIGTHNLENILAASLAAYVYKINPLSIERAISKFTGIEHRIEYFGNILGIPVYNDSKATNYKAMKTAIVSFPKKKILLICGGKYRKDNINILDGNIENLQSILIAGENSNEIIDYFNDKNIFTHTFSNLKEVSDNINKYLDGIDVILFSPGASSYDAFHNFEERGTHFKHLISSLDYFTKNSH